MAKSEKREGVKVIDAKDIKGAKSVADFGKKKKKK